MHVSSCADDRSVILSGDSLLLQEGHVGLGVVDVDPVVGGLVEGPAVGLAPNDVLCWWLALGGVNTRAQ